MKTILGMLLWALATPAFAATKTHSPACKIRYLPLLEGAVWLYQLEESPEREPNPGLAVPPPRQIQIEVVRVEVDEKSTRIRLRESFRKVVQETTLTCSPSGLDVPINSFLFAAEPGGGRAMTYEVTAQKGTTYPGSSGLRPGMVTFLELKATVTRQSSESSAIAGRKGASAPGVALELERQLDVKASESVMRPEGPVRAHRVSVQLTGRVRANGASPDTAPTGLASDAPSSLWFANDIGLVRAVNSLGESWMLREYRPPAQE